jgi:hypothetical protein
MTIAIINTPINNSNIFCPLLLLKFDEEVLLQCRIFFQKFFGPRVAPHRDRHVDGVKGIKG